MPSPPTTRHAGAAIAAAQTSPLLNTSRRDSTELTLPSRMATAAMQAPAAALRPFSFSSRFLTGGSLQQATTADRECSQPNARHLPPSRRKPRKVDNGFDPLGLAEDPENLRWFVQPELVNERWAMLGVAGMLLPEVLTKIGIINAPQWYDAGKAEYFASYSTLFVFEFILFHYVEIRRWQDIKNPGSVNQDPRRLAMSAFLGFIIQHNVTSRGPFENLLQHLSDPWRNTIIQTFQG